MIVGIDPGVSGAVAFVERGEVRAVYDMPARAEGKHNIVDGRALAHILTRGAPDLALLERVNPMPARGPVRRKMGAASAFNFGESFGAVRGILDAFHIDYILVHPISWKTRAGLIGEDKEASLELARDRHPDLLALKVQRGRTTKAQAIARAESILIAEFGGV